MNQMIASGAEGYKLLGMGIFGGLAMGASAYAQGKPVPVPLMPWVKRKRFR